jgi:hypothetical protein
MGQSWAGRGEEEKARREGAWIDRIGFIVF